MDEVNIDGVIIISLKKIHHPKGDILHVIKKRDEGFVGFGEAYFTTIKDGEIKGWNKHKKMTLNLVVPVGKVTFVLFDNKEEIDSKNNFFKVELSSNNYQRLTIPPGVWFAFIGGKYETNLILNVANIEHDPDELDRLEINQIDCNWNHI